MVIVPDGEVHSDTGTSDDFPIGGEIPIAEPEDLSSLGGPVVRRCRLRVSVALGPPDLACVKQIRPNVGEPIRGTILPAQPES